MTWLCYGELPCLVFLSVSSSGWQGRRDAPSAPSTPASSRPIREPPKQTTAAKSPHADKTNKQTSSGKSPHHRGTQYGHYWKAATRISFSDHNGRDGEHHKEKISTFVRLVASFRNLNMSLYTLDEATCGKEHLKCFAPPEVTANITRNSDEIPQRL